MFERNPNVVTSRGFMVVAICLALLAGCIPDPRDIAPVPANLAAAGGIAAIALTWEASAGATSYNLKRSATSGGPYTQLATTTAPTYADSTVTAGTVYFYVVSSVAADGESANSTQASATRATLPLAPTNLVATAGNAQASLTWSAGAGATSYNVKRGTATGGPYTQVATSASTSYTNTSLVNGTTYFFVVSAVSAAGESANSAQVSASPNVINPPPTTFGTWIDVTPQGVDLVSQLCSNYGATSIQTDPAHPSHLYTLFHCQGIWKSTDYGATWTGPINTGSNGSVVNDCSGGITIPPISAANIPTIYASCIRGAGIGFWRSLDGGVNWTRYDIAGLSRQDYNPPVVDPYDQNHLLMAGHEIPSAADTIVESTDGGQNWTRVPVANGMLQNGRSPLIFFINTGNATTTRGTWLWIGDASGGAFGTWRTASSGATWVQVDGNEHILDSYIYQPDASGAVYMAGASGVLRSADHGLTWTRVGQNMNQTVVFGTPKNVYGMYGYPTDPGGFNNPLFQLATQPGTGTWVSPGTPAGLTQGAAQVAVVNNGANNILVGAMWKKGVWRYIEP